MWVFRFRFREEAKAEVKPWRFGHGDPKVLRLEERSVGHGA